MSSAGSRGRRALHHLLLALMLVAAGGDSLAHEHYGEERPFTHYTTGVESSPLSSASVQKVYQDRLGFIWLGFFSSGLTRFDGHNAVAYGVEDGLPDLTVREITEDADGRLWVGTESGLAVSEQPLDRYPAGTRLRFVRQIGDRTIPHVRMRRGCLVSDSHGTIWVGTQNDGIFRYRQSGAQTEVTHLATDVLTPGRNEAVNSLVIRADGSVWAALGSGGFFLSSPDGVDRHYRPRGKGSPDSEIVALHEGRGRVLWAGGSHGELYRAHGSRADSFERIASPLTERVTTILETADNELWVGSLGSGVLHLRDSDTPRPGARRYRRNEGLLGDTVWSILSDREQNIWIAENGGLSRLSHNHDAFGWLTGESHGGTPPLLPDPATFAVLPRIAGARAGSPGSLIWIATGSGLTAISADGASASISSATGLRASSVYSLTRDSGGRIWAGTAEGLNAVVMSETPPPAGLELRTTTEMLGQSVAVFAATSSGQFYAVSPVMVPANASQVSNIEAVCGAGSTGLVCHVDGILYRFGAKAGVPATATGFAMDVTGHLWVTTSDSGTFRSSEPFALAAIRRAAAPAGETPDVAAAEIVKPFFAPLWKPGEGPASDSMRAIVRAGDEMWIASTAGVVVADAQSGAVRATITRAEGLENETIASIAVSQKTGHVWISNNRGLIEIDPASRRLLRTVAKHDGLLDEETWGYAAISIAPEGTLYFATSRGICFYRPDADSGMPAAPLVRITGVELRKARAGAREFYISYSALSFATEDQVRYRTRLVGYDDTWSSETPEVRTRFTNLRAVLFPKVHTFEVLATNGHGIWTPEPARYSFVVAPPWWLTWLAFLFYILLGLLFIAAFERFRTARFKRRTRELEDLVAARTVEIRSQARELETVDQIVRAINREVSLERVLQALIDEGRALFPQAEKAVFLLSDNERGVCEVAALSGYDPELFAGMRLTLDEAKRRYTVDAEQLESGVYLVRNTTPLLTPRMRGPAPLPKSMLAMELRVEERLEGFLIFDNFTDPQAFDRSDLDKLLRFREHAVSAVSKARMLRELETKNREVLQASEAKSAFLANMSHELRTPMNAIIGFSEILVDRLDGQIAARYHNFLRMILASGQHLLSIVNDILDLSKIEAGKMEIYPEVFDVGQAVEGVALVMRGVASKRGVTVRVELPPDLPMLEADSAKFKQVLYNLLSNAVKFSPAQSVVRVVAKRIDHPEIGDALSVAVIDQGIGIAAEHQQLIFQAFRQVDATARRQYGGTGLGLALVRKYTELQGGVVTLESQPGSGSTFTFILPVQFRGTVAPAAVADRDTRRPRVLVVEDDPLWFETIRGYLAAAGYLALMARNGDEAMRLARQGNLCAITLDLLLPDIDGLDLLKQLKADETTRDLPVVIVSLSENRDVAMALGADDYFVKPLDRSRFVARMNELASAFTSHEHELHTVLVIDDDPSVAEILSEDVAPSGFRVTAAIDGTTGLEMAHRDSPDVIVLDLFMPGLDGFQVADALRRDAATAHIPVIVLTAGELTDEDRQQLRQSTANILTKGESGRRRLIEELEKIAQRYRSQAETPASPAPENADRPATRRAQGQP